MEERLLDLSPGDARYYNDEPAEGAPTEVFRCTEPGCGRSFTSQQGLTMHRTIAHKIPGARSRRRVGSRERRQSQQRPSPQRQPVPAKPVEGPVDPTPAEQGVNRNALLRIVFPDGIPPKQDTLTRVSVWLDEAEALTKLK